MASIDYNAKSKRELVLYCKETGIRGYAANKITKEQIIKLIIDYTSKETSAVENYKNMKYEALLELCRERNIKGYITKSSTGTATITKEGMINALTENIVKISLFEHITKYNPTIITKFVGNQDILKTALPGTNKYFTWKCDTLNCLNTFEAIPRNVYNNNLPRKYCDTCTHQNRQINKQNTILKRSGAIITKFPFIIDIWSSENNKMPDDLSPGSNEIVTLKCPNKSTNHPDYKIAVCKIQEHNQYRCSKCVTKSSNAEMRLYSELKYTFEDVKWQQKIKGREADITIEDIKLVIEVDGFPWHKDKSNKDLEKNAIFERNGYSVLRIRDSRLEEISCDHIVCDLVNLSLVDYNKIISFINISHDCNIELYDVWQNHEYYKELQASKMSIKYEESIEHLFPESKELWDYEKNHPFIPSQFSQGSDMELWLKCCNNHSWKRQLSHLFRTIKGKKHIMKCPECIIPRSNNKCLKINDKIYKSISEFCKQTNNDRHDLYRKLKQNNIDLTSLENIQKFIEDHILK